MKTLNLEDLSSLKQKDFNNTIKIIPTYLLERLNQLELPIKNKEIALSNICNFLTYILNIYHNTEKSIIAIDREVFISYFNNRLYPKYKELLKECKVLTAVPYEDGTFYSKDNGICLQYRIHNEFLESKEFTALLFKPNKKEMSLDLVYEGPRKFVNTIINEELDYEKVFKNEIEYHKLNDTTEFSLYSRLVRALSLRSNRYIKQGNKVNRVYHSFSNLSKITRKCFKTNFKSIDLKNSQPAFLVYYLILNKIEFEPSYKELVENGKFYELFYDLYDGDRDKVKVAVYESLFFAFNETRRVNKRFKELFPLVWNELKRINDKGITLASILQNYESDLFNNLKVKNSTRYFTLFDAIYYNNEKDKKMLTEQIMEYGMNNGIKFTLSYE